MARYIEGTSRTDSKGLTRELFRKYVAKEDKVLELGSERGTLLYYLRGTGYKIQESDVDKEVIRRRRRFGETNIRRANVYHLPYSSGEFDCVVGLDFFDVLEDLNRGIKESRRVLKPQSGILIAIHDQGMRSDSLYKTNTDRDRLALPFFNSFTEKADIPYQGGVCLLDRRDIIALLKRLSNKSKKMLREFVKTQSSSLVDKNVSSFKEIQKALFKLGIKPEIKLAKDEFPISLRSSLIKNGFEIIQSGKVQHIGYAKIHPVPLSFEYDMNIPSYEIPAKAKMLHLDPNYIRFLDCLNPRIRRVPREMFPILNETFVTVARKK